MEGKEIKNRKKKKGKIQKKIEKEKSKTKGEKKNQRKKKSLSSVILDKMRVFCLYPIPDSQQCLKRGSCRHPILSGLLFVLIFVGL